MAALARPRVYQGLSMVLYLVGPWIVAWLRMMFLSAVRLYAQHRRLEGSRRQRFPRAKRLQCSRGAALGGR